MSMFEASDAESVEGLQISCHGNVTSQVNNISFSQEVSPKNLRQSCIFEGSLANKTSVLAFKASFLKVVSRKSSGFFLRFKASFLKEVSQKKLVGFQDPCWNEVSQKS